MQLLNIFPLAFLASTVLADGAAIVAAISRISSDTIELQSTVADWAGDLLGTVPIIADSSKLLENIEAGIHVAEASANLSVPETLSVASATEGLVADVETALAAVVGARRKFIDLWLGPVIELDLELEKSATDKFSQAVISKVPAELQALAALIVAPVDVAFEYAIGNFTDVL